MNDPKTAIVTGAGSGIGRATASLLLASGWQVVLAGRRQDALEATAAGAPGALVLPTDVTDAQAVQRLFAGAVERFGRVDLLFNNAGVAAPTAPTETLSDADWQMTIATCVTGAFHCVREAFRTMGAQRPQGGRIISTGSIAAHAPRPNMMAYSAAKHALTGITRSAALDGRRYRIAVSQLDLGNVAVGRAGEEAPAAAGTLARKQRVQADGSLAPEALMDPMQVAQAVLHIANLPLEVNVLFHTLMPTDMPYVGRG